MKDSVSLDRLIKVQLVRKDSFSTGKPFETLPRFFVLKEGQYLPSGYSKEEVEDYDWQIQMFRGAWSAWADDLGFEDDGRAEVEIPEPWEVIY